MREHAYGEAPAQYGENVKNPAAVALTVQQKYADERMQAHIDRTFDYQPPQGDQPQRYRAITRATKELAQLYIDLAPPSAELTLALRALEEARMRCNQAIAVNETSTPPVVSGT